MNAAKWVLEKREVIDVSTGERRIYNVGPETTRWEGEPPTRRAWRDSDLKKDGQPDARKFGAIVGGKHRLQFPREDVEVRAMAIRGERSELERRRLALHDELFALYGLKP